MFMHCAFGKGARTSRRLVEIVIDERRIIQTARMGDSYTDHECFTRVPPRRSWQECSALTLLLRKIHFSSSFPSVSITSAMAFPTRPEPPVTITTFWALMGAEFYVLLFPGGTLDVLALVRTRKVGVL